ncbi:MAG: isochorismatase [Chthoniobacterales bacterium]
MSQETVLEAVKKGSALWQAAFNAGDAAGCASAYEIDAVIEARPLGTFRGSGEILGLWATLIADGYVEVEYSDTKIAVMDDTSAILTGEWKMNNASGVIHKELWVMQDDGTAKMREDNIEVTG